MQTEMAPEQAVTKMADVIASRVGATMAFGEPVERGNVTIVPVARASWGFGGGGGKPKQDRDGFGGGGGARVHPVGYIIVRERDAEFRPFRTPAASLLLIFSVGALIGATIGRLTRM